MRPSESFFLLARRFLTLIRKRNFIYSTGLLFYIKNLSSTSRSEAARFRASYKDFTTRLTLRANIEQKPHGVSLKLVIFWQTLTMWQTSCLIKHLILSKLCLIELLWFRTSPKRYLSQAFLSTLAKVTSEFIFTLSSQVRRSQFTRFISGQRSVTNWTLAGNWFINYYITSHWKLVRYVIVDKSITTPQKTTTSTTTTAWRKLIVLWPKRLQRDLRKIWTGL